MENKNKSVRMEGIKFYHTHTQNYKNWETETEKKNKQTHGNRYKALCCCGLENT